MAVKPSQKRATAKASFILDNLVTRAKGRHDGRPGRGEGEEGGRGRVEKCPPPQSLCAETRRADGPEQRLRFRSSVSLGDDLNIHLGDPVEHEAPLEYSCAPVVDAVAEFILDLLFQQDWFFNAKVIGGLSTSIAIAPGERTTLTIRNTQRKLFDQTTLDQTERATEAESTFSDKEVVNVARTSSRTNNWSLSGEGSFGIGDFSVGASGSVSETVANTANSSAERVQESTSKSSEQLRSLHKVEVRESTEITTEQGRTRVIENPYRDRSIRLDIYELQKIFCVEFSLIEIAPRIAVDIRSLRFDESFVLTNGGFLADSLMDQTLASELAQALALTDQLNEFDDRRSRAESMALLALNYLFGTVSMFGLTVADTPDIESLRGQGFPLNLPAGWNESDPATSFINPLEYWSGLRDAIANGATNIFTTLAFFRRVYVDRVLIGPPADGRLALEIVTSLETVIGPIWAGAETPAPDTPASATHLNDMSHATEIFRRLAGFLTFVSGVIRPLLQSTDDTSAASARRAELVIRRVVAHLSCHRRYYTERFMWYMAQRSHQRTLTEFARTLLSRHLPNTNQAVLALFDPTAAFLDKTSVVIPLRRAIPPADVLALIGAASKGKGPQIGVIERRMVTVPTDGWHIEPSVGSCVLDGVPPPARPTPVPLAVEGIEGLTVQP